MNSETRHPDPLHERAGTFGELLRVALPLIISAGSTAMMYVIDRVMLSWESLDTMAAALPAGVLHWNIMVLALGTVAYGNAFIGQYEGAGDHHRVGPVVWQGVYFSLAAAALVALFAPLSPAVFRWFGHPENIQGYEVRYFSIMCYGTLPLLLDTALSCFFSGRGKTLVVMFANITGMLINVALDYALILGKFGFPRMGIDGAALATVTAFACITLIYLGVILWTERRHSPYRLWAGRRFDRGLFTRLLRFGLPTGVQQFLDVACFTAFIQLVASLGADELAATGLVFNLNGLVFVPLLGLGTAVTVLVGHRIGEGRPRLAVRTAWLAYALAAVYTGLFCVVYLAVPDLILRPYGLDDHDAVRQVVVYLLRFVAVYSWFDSMVVVFGAAIRGAGDTLFAMLLSFTLGIVLMVLPTGLAITFTTDGFEVAWYAVTVYITVLGLGLLARFQQGRWQSMRIIEHVAGEVADVETTERTDESDDADRPVGQALGA
ncbi:MAG: MATE family efflux transporter [Pirellulales bacterium]